MTLSNIPGHSSTEPKECAESVSSARPETKRKTYLAVHLCLDVELNEEYDASNQSGEATD